MPERELFQRKGPVLQIEPDGQADTDEVDSHGGIEDSEADHPFGILIEGQENLESVPVRQNCISTYIPASRKVTLKKLAGVIGKIVTLHRQPPGKYVQTSYHMNQLPVHRPPEQAADIFLLR